MDNALRDLPVATQAKPPLKVFFCYAHKDEPLRLELERHLEPLKNLGQVITWHDRVLLPGAKWENEIDIHLNTSDIILLLISPHFMSSQYCYGKEMSRALKRRKTGETQVIPIILRPVDWKETPIGELQVLPRDGKPISRWSNRDEAFLDVVKGIRQVIATIHVQRTKTYQINDGDSHCNVFHYSEALVSYERALQLDPGDPQLRLKVGDILLRLGLYEKALDHYKEVLHLYNTSPEGCGFPSRDSYEIELEKALLSRDIADVQYFLLERFDEARGFYEARELYKKAVCDPPSTVSPLKRSMSSYMLEPWQLGRVIPGLFNFPNRRLRRRAKRRKRSFSEIPRTPAGTLRSLHPRLSRELNSPGVIPLLVDTIYNVVLERHADSIGIEAYGKALTQGRILPSGNGRIISMVGEMTVREVVRHIGHSSEYRDRFIANQVSDEALKLCYKHFLGRETKGEELRSAAEIAQLQGFDALIDLLIDSDEYMQVFGEKVPFIRST